MLNAAQEYSQQYCNHYEWSWSFNPHLSIPEFGFMTTAEYLLCEKDAKMKQPELISVTSFQSSRSDKMNDKLDGRGKPHTKEEVKSEEKSRKMQRMFRMRRDCFLITDFFIFNQVITSSRKAFLAGRSLLRAPCPCTCQQNHSAH